MIVPLFAMPPAGPLFFSWSIGLILVLALVHVFVNATRTPKKRREQNRRAGLGLMAIVCGPLVGASLAWLVNALGDVHPRDVTYTYVVFTVIGGIAGVVAGVVFAITGILCTRDLGGKGISDKSVSVTDEL
jgi:hypothetical protein